MEASIQVDASRWKLMEASMEVDGSFRGKLRLFPRKLPSTSMEDFLRTTWKFPSRIYFYPLPSTSMEVSTYFQLTRAPFTIC